MRGIGNIEGATEFLLYAAGGSGRILRRTDIRKHDREFVAPEAGNAMARIN